ncbi:rhodanese-like domain-containing protein [Isoptericola jiangsuensis]|uniref:Rhodanese-like domain-containing protein n=1 Tax=Isoptericola jiangsuensis TaxID=548579 RepID=A0A2A9EYK8_9MICO|nr:rhodanese-like domain-containing protein [Isoptericola jiangsuensis]PFG43382.1 rhodanese-like domain-containing protein [Isoptericola jiangsuensis]
MSRTRTTLGTALALTGALALAGCADTGTADTPLDPDAVVIDVRTPAEYAEGHLEGALNIDVQSADAVARFDELDPTGTYVVYCRSGNRAEAALDLLTTQGFDDVTNAGSLRQAATATGLDVVG